MAKDRPTGTPVLRRMNTAAVLDAVRRAAPVPQRLVELVELTGLTRPTVAQAVDQLVASGWLLEHAPAPLLSGGGRPAIRVSLNGRAAPVLGLDVGPHTVTAGVADAAGEPLAVAHRKVRHRGPKHLLALVEEVLAAALLAADVPVGAIAMVVVATPGIVDSDTGRVLYAPSLPGWTSINLVEYLRPRFACPVLIENDANLAALAVAHEQLGKGTVLAVRWGERLGAGVIIDGRLHRGAGAAGEIGFIRHTGVGPPGMGEGGPLERAIGAAAIVRLARQQANGRTDSGMAGVLDAAGVFSGARGGDPVALAVVEQVGSTLATALAPALLVLCPDTVVISGGIARAGDILHEVVGRHLAELTLIPPRVELSSLAEDATLTGAFRMALDHVWQRELTTASERGHR
jgi:predicted NBD/HSP70 family sugar kinase